MMYDQFFPFGMMGGLFGVISMIFWWILVALAIIALVRWIRDRGHKEEEINPMEILKQRYAKGAIDKEEFERIKKDIE